MNPGTIIKVVYQDGNDTRILKGKFVSEDEFSLTLDVGNNIIIHLL